MNLEKVKSWLKQNWQLLAIFIVYAAITFIALCFHESWEDEAQAWLLVRDCSLFELIGRMQSEGHLLPWYFIIMPFAKLGLPYATIKIISWAITCLTAWLMLKYLPCKTYKRVLFIFTLPMIYLFPVIARCYCLLPLAVILAIMFYKNRFEKPIPYLLSIVLVANIHTYTFMFALIMGLEFFIDWLRSKKAFSKKQNRLILFSVIGTVILVTLSYLPLLGSIGENGSSEITIDTLQDNLLIQPTDHLKGLFIDTPLRFIRIVYDGDFQTIFFIFLSFLIVFEFFTHKSIFFKIALSIVWQFCIIYFLFGTILPQRVVISIFIILFFVSCYSWRKNLKPLFSKKIRSRLNLILDICFILLAIWLEISTGNFYLAFIPFFAILLFVVKIYIKIKRPSLKQKYINLLNRLANASLILLSLFFIYIGFTHIINDINNPYTDAPATATYINENLPENSIVLTVQESSIVFVSVIPYLDYQQNRFYNINQNAFYTFKSILSDHQTLIDDIDWREYCTPNQQLYFLISPPFLSRDVSTQFSTSISTLVDNNILTEIFSVYTPNIAAPTEHYSLYKVSPSICQE